MVNTHAGTLSTVHIPYVSHGILTWSCDSLIRYAFFECERVLQLLYMCTMFHYLLQHNFVTGNKIQLVSKINGRALQVAKTDDGGFIVNGAGDLGPTAQNGINLSNIILKEIVNLNKKRLFWHYK